MCGHSYKVAIEDKTDGKVYCLLECTKCGKYKFLHADDPDTLEPLARKQYEAAMLPPSCS